MSRRGKLHEYNGRRLTLREWATELNVSIRVVTQATTHGWHIEDVVLGRYVETRRGRTARRWTAEEEATVQKLAADGKSERDIALAIDRSPLAVRVRLSAIAAR